MNNLKYILLATLSCFSATALLNIFKFYLKNSEILPIPIIIIYFLFVVFGQTFFAVLLYYLADFIDRLCNGRTAQFFTLIIMGLAPAIMVYTISYEILWPWFKLIISFLVFVHFYMTAEKIVVLEEEIS